MTDKNRITEVKSEQWETGSDRQVATFKVTQLIWLMVGILEAALALRFLLKLIAANPSSPIAALIYDFTDLFLIPFSGLTVTPAAGGMVLEISTLIAMLIFGLVGWAFERLVWVVFYRPRGPIVEVTQTKSHEDRSNP